MYKDQHEIILRPAEDQVGTSKNISYNINTQNWFIVCMCHSFNIHSNCSASLKHRLYLGPVNQTSLIYWPNVQLEAQTLDKVWANWKSI